MRINILIVLLFCLLLLSPVSKVNAVGADQYQDANSEIEALLKEIEELENSIQNKKLRIQKLAYGEKEDTIEWNEIDFDISSDILGTPSFVKIEKIGIDYSKVNPELVIIYYTKNITSEKQSPDRGLDGSLQYETESEKDWIHANEYNTYLIKDGDSYLEGNRYDLPAKIAPGWEGYFRKTFILDQPGAEYYLVDGFLDGYEWKIAIDGTDEEFGTPVQPGN